MTTVQVDTDDPRSLARTSTGTKGPTERPPVGLRRAAQERLWPLALAYALAATTLVITNAPGRYIPDNRFDQYWNPGRRLARYLVVWDGTRGLGRSREEFWPAATLPVALYRWLGASPWLAQRLWHATLMVVGGLGMVMVLRLYRRRIDWAHVLAGTLYMFGPYSLTFLVPSNLYFHYAMAPWFLVVVVRGVHSQRPWRWAATFALMIWGVGNLDTPGLIYSGVPIVIALVFALTVERSVTVRHSVAWLARAAVLSVAVSGPALFKTYAGAGALAQRLASTETPEAVASASSWSESFRGLGLWLSYFRDGFGLNRPQGLDYFTAPVVIVATFAVVVVALVGMWRLPGRPRLLFGALLASGTLLMVGAHPPNRPSPYGHFLLTVLDTVPSLAALRATYKAGAGYAMGAAALFGLTIQAAHRHARDRSSPRLSRLWRAAPLSVGGLTVALAAWPLWHGDLYDPAKQLDEVPDYWYEALAWLDTQGSDPRVMFAPGTTRSPYRWGWPGDDLHDALLGRSHVLDIAITLSNPLPTDLIGVLDDNLSDRRYRPGTFAPIARRLGIEHLVIRNDLRWDITASPRPAEFSRLRDDPDLELVATFGEPGENTTGISDQQSAVERRLPPVEVYQVQDPLPMARMSIDEAPLLVSGSGDAWMPLADLGLLDRGNPVVYTGSLTPPQLREDLDRGAGVVVTDTNRRRALAVQTYNSDTSQTIAAGQQLERPAEDLFLVAGSQTVSWMADATQVDDPGLFRPLDGFRTQFRPSNAFDGDPATGWVAPAIPNPTTRSLRLAFREPQTLTEIEIRLVPDPDTPSTADPSATVVQQRVLRAQILFSDGSSTLATWTSRPDPDAPDAESSVGFLTTDFTPVRTTSVEIDIEAVSGPGSVGISEVTFPDHDLDTVEYLQVPDDVFRAADHNRGLREALAEAPVTYLFERLFDSTPVEEEAHLRRRFLSDGRTVRLEAVLTSEVPGSLVPGSQCRDVGLLLDGDPVPVRLEATAPDPRKPLRPRATASACEPERLSPGWHLLASTGDVKADRVMLSDGDLPRGSDGEAPDLTATQMTLTEQRYTVSQAETAGLFLSGQSYAPVWQATLEGRSLGPPYPADTQNAWRIPAGQGGGLRVWTPNQRLFELLMSASFLALVACAGLVLRR